MAEHGARHDEADRRPLIAGPLRPGAAEEVCRVAVLGGGPAGCATALALARLGVDGVVVVEAGRYEEVRVGESVPPDTWAPLARLGVLDSFLADGHDACYGSCSSWGADELGYNDFLFNPHGHGWHLDRRRFDARLATEAAAAGVALRIATRFLGLERERRGGRPRLVLEDAAGERRRLAAELIVDATGPRALLARAMGARRVFLDKLICVTGFLDPPPAGSFPHLTLLEAVETGWWYAARLPGGRLAVAVAGDGEAIRAGGLGRPAGWRAGPLLPSRSPGRRALAGGRRRRLGLRPDLVAGDPQGAGRRPAGGRGPAPAAGGRAGRLRRLRRGAARQLRALRRRARPPLRAGDPLAGRALLAQPSRAGDRGLSATGAVSERRRQ